MALQSGTKLGRYEVAGPIGTSDVYQARDTESGGQVRIAVLPKEVAEDAVRLERLGREVEALSALDNPRIGTTYALESSDDTRFLVLEPVQGDTLADRLKRGAIPTEDALRLALQIAEVLEVAHEKGIVHRDLNPSNIRIAPDSHVRIVDFGLATMLATDGEGSTPDFSHSPTLSVTATRSGSLSGTAAYMSPEQARGEPSGTSADIWAFACVLFEMLSGRPAFGGGTQSDVRASVLRDEPEWSRLPAGLHPWVRYLLERCLHKDAASRPQEAAAVRADIARSLESSPDVSVASAPDRAASVLPWVAGVVLAALLGLTVSWGLRPDQSSSVVRFHMWASSPGGFQQALQAVSPQLGISPDGTRIVFRGIDGRLFLRDRDDMASRPVQIAGETGHLNAPFFSPDGEDLFFTDMPLPDLGGFQFAAPVAPTEILPPGVPDPGLDLERVPVAGGTATPVLTDRSEYVLDGSFSADDTILFADGRGSIYSVSVNGGEPDRLLEEVPGARFPQLLPGGWILYSNGDLVTPLVDDAPLPTGEIVVQSLVDPADRRVIWEGGTHAQYVPETGHIVYLGMTQPGLWAFTFDVDRLARTGDPVPLVDGLIVDYALSGTGSLAYAAVEGYEPVTGGLGGSDSVLAVVDVGGAIVRRLRVDPGTYRNPRVSPDGNRVLYEFVEASGASHIYVYDLVGDFPRKLTFEGENNYPIWKDDTSVTYASERDGAWSVYSQTLEGGQEEMIVSAPEGSVYRPQAWSAEETLVLVIADENGGARSGRLAMLLAGEDEPVAIAPYEPGADEFGASLSPDGGWLAYMVQCDAPLGCARVQRFPPVPGSSIEIREVDTWVQFSPNSTQLVTSRAPALFFWTVAIEGGRIDVAAPSRRGLNGFQTAQDHRSFDLRGPDGQDLVMVVPAGAAVTDSQESGNDVAAISSQIDFFHDFLEVLKERVEPSGAR